MISVFVHANVYHPFSKNKKRWVKARSGVHFVGLVHGKEANLTGKKFGASRKNEKISFILGAHYSN